MCGSEIQNHEVVVFGEEDSLAQNFSPGLVPQKIFGAPYLFDPELASPFDPRDDNT